MKLVKKEFTKLVMEITSISLYRGTIPGSGAILIRAQLGILIKNIYKPMTSY